MSLHRDYRIDTVFVQDWDNSNDFLKLKINLLDVIGL
jgi:hypothetical protein